MAKPLPAAITSYDLIKAFALVIMIIDHIGYYFYPEDLWWRAIGRMGTPVWFFLVGYADTRDIPAKLWGGAFLLLAVNVVVGMALLPLNVLVTIMVLRLIIDPVMRAVTGAPELRWFVFIISIPLLIPTNIAVEYGSAALLFAMAGYMVRHREGMGFSKAQVQNFMIATCLLFLMFQFLNFGFAPVQFAVVAAVIILLCAILYDFRPATYPAATAVLPGMVTFAVQLCGRRTLEIYVLHLIAFKLVTLALGHQNLTAFNFHIL